MSIPEQSAERISPWAVLLGALCVAVLAAANPYSTFVYRVWSVGSGSLLSGAVVMLLLILLLNGFLLRLSPRKAFSRGQLLAVYGMMIVSIGLAMQGGLLYMVSGTTYPFYMASPENGWQQLILPYIPSWLQLSDLRASDWYWEGLPEGVAIPWSAWARPMGAWFSFTLALIGAMFCLGSLVSKDWVERQKLTFPLVEVPLAMAGDKLRPALRDGILSSRVFWLGFSIPAFFAILAWLNRIYPEVPSVKLTGINLGGNFAGMGTPWTEFSDIMLSFLFPVIGISCLLPGEVSLSLWFFYLLYRIQLFIWAALGVTEGGQAAGGINPRSFISFEEAGGFIALSILTIYQSRKTILGAFRGLFKRQPSELDPYEPLEGRWALLGFFLCHAFMLALVMRAGMSWWSFTLIIGLFYTVLIGASRLVAAAGVMYVDTGAFPRGVVLRTLGAARFDPASLTMYSYLSLIYMYDPMNLAMPQIMNSFKLLRSGRLEGKRWPWTTALSILVMLIVGWAALLLVIYRHDGANRTWLWDYPQWAFGELDATLRTPETSDIWLRLALASGAAFTLLLSWMNTNYLWWPLSPIGFVIASSWSMNFLLWGSVFIGWSLSTVIRRIGGLKLYRQMRPAFLGLILGDYLTRAALAGLSAVFGIKAGVSYGW